MTFNWYKLFNQTEFAATELVSRELEVFLDGIGLKTVLVTRGNLYSILYEGVFLPVRFLGSNPFVRDGFGVYKDADENVWLGIVIDED